MKKILLTSIVITSFLSCTNDTPIPNQVVTSALKSDANILYAKATINSANEVPTNASTATGEASGTFDKTSKILKLNINYTDITPTAWHIHKAAAGSNGGVVFNFGSDFKSPFAYASAALTETQEADLIAGLNYVNIHSAKSPGGEIRGQLAVAASTATGSVLGSYNKSTKQLSVAITYIGLTPTVWHIHKGALGTSGPVVLDLGTTFTSPFNYTSTLTADQETDLLAGLYYVNIHSKNAPGGEIRGQLAVN